MRWANVRYSNVRCGGLKSGGLKSGGLKSGVLQTNHSMADEAEGSTSRLVCFCEHVHTNENIDISPTI